MSDWEVVQNNQAAPQSTSDWEVFNEPVSAKQQQRPQESIGKSLLFAAPRVGEDLVRSVWGGIKNLPGYLESARTEIPGLFKETAKHPGHAALQALAGLNESVNNLAQLPKGIAEYGANRLNLLPESTVKAMQKITPEDTTQAINQLFGQPQYEGEKLLRGVMRNIASIGAGAKVASVLNPLNLTAGSIAKDVLKTRERNIKQAGKEYNSLWKEAKKQGFYDMKHVVPEIDIETLRKYSPKKSIDSVEDFLANPNLQTAHNAKSDLLRMQRELEKLTTLKGAERKQLKAAKNAIENISNNMFKKSYGYTNNALLDKYSKIQQGYAQNVIPYKNQAIGKYKRGELLPNELVNALSRGEFMAKKGKEHPELSRRKMVLPTLAGAGAVGAGSGLKWLYDALHENDSANQ